MRRDISRYSPHQVFLNYPYDDEFQPFALCLTFGVVAAGLLPLCALDLASPDTVRLGMLVDAIGSCHYSVHDLSRAGGEGPDNLARMNMPIEMGMALYHALSTQLREHRCAFFVPTPHEYHAFASDLSGLDPKCYDGDPLRLLSASYEWLRDIVPIASRQATPEVVAAYREFLLAHEKVALAGNNKYVSHAESRELMYRVSAERGWWDWRETRAGREEFPEVPLQWRGDPPNTILRSVDATART